MNRRILGLVGALLLAALGTVMIVAYVHGADTRALKGEKTTRVLVVKNDVPPGTPAEQLGDRVGLTTVVQNDVAQGAVTDVKQLSGRVTSAELVPGEQVVTGRFVDASALRAGGGVTVPAGMLQTTIKLDPERAVGGLLTPGAKVALAASFDDKSNNTVATSHILLHHVLVTNVQLNQSSDANAFNTKPSGSNNAAGPGNAPSGQLLVTLALDAPSVERVVFSAEHGSIWLSVEPDDASATGTKIVTRSNVQ